MFLVMLKDVQTYTIKPAIRKGVVVGIRVFNGFKKIIPGTIPLQQIEPKALDEIKRMMGPDVKFEARFVGSF